MGNQEIERPRTVGFIANGRNLEVFKKSYKVSLAIHEFSLALPKIEQYDLGSQIRRASKSVCANIIEGFSKQAHYPQDFKRFLSTSLGSCDEMQLWLQYSLDLGYITPQDYSNLNNKYENIGKMLRSLRNKVKA